jgi:4-amino-4-deoxy-L-arabinose transferase-like glycosyltransferase
MSSGERAAGGSPSAITWGIIAAVFAWGIYLAIGAMTAPGRHGAIRGAIVFGCTLAFLGLWLAALAVRKRRIGPGRSPE